MVILNVSTHSRLKAAGYNSGSVSMTFILCFNTQPPEGGWMPPLCRWIEIPVSTHSRLKAAGGIGRPGLQTDGVSTHSRLKAAGLSFLKKDGQENVSTHSRLKAAGASSGIPEKV